MPTRSEISDQVWKKLKEPLLRNELTIRQLDPAKLLAALEVSEVRNDRLSTEVRNALLEASLAPGEALKATSEHSIVNVMHKMRLRAEEAEGRLQQQREALVAAVPFLFEYGGHWDDRCYRGSDDGCYCGLDEAQKLADKVLSPGAPGADAEVRERK